MTNEQIQILVVDDEEPIRQVLLRTLEGVGYNVVTAANGQEALDKVSELEIEAVLLDIKMPGMSGMEVLQQLTTNWPDICVIMVTGVDEAPQTAYDTLKAGAYDYITKPFNSSEVIVAVQRAIKKRNLRLEKERQLRP